jgi:hypothetical protein
MEDSQRYAEGPQLEDPTLVLCPEIRLQTSSSGKKVVGWPFVHGSAPNNGYVFISFRQRVWSPPEGKGKHHRRSWDAVVFCYRYRTTVCEACA